MVPMLDEAIELGAAQGALDVVIGMAHRGRLNVLAHIVGRPYESILREFEGERIFEAVVADPEGGTGDVKYHLAAHGDRRTADGETEITLAPNPSHLEAVDPVVEGRARAEQTDRGSGRRDPRPERRAADPDPRRRILRRPGGRRGDLQPAEPRGLRHRRARSTSSPTTRSASRPIRWKADPRATPAIWPRASTCRSSTSTPTTRRLRSRRSDWRWHTGTSSATTSSSTSSATAASATARGTRRRTRSR